MARRLVTRRDDDLSEPWAALSHSVRDSPNPEAARADFASNWLRTIADLIGDTTPARTHAAIVACQLVGLAEGIRVLGLFPNDELASDDLVDMWAPILQAQIDAINHTDTNSTEPR